jgi:hypothetical protein
MARATDPSSWMGMDSFRFTHPDKTRKTPTTTHHRRMPNIVLNIETSLLS